MSNFASNDNMTALFTAAGEKIGERAKIFPGTKAEWDALPLSEKIKYDYVAFAGDSQSGIVDDTPTEDSEHLVKSGGVFDSLATKANLTQISNPNLLDNPWFTVNQRGQSSYSTTGADYTFDRWFSFDGNTSVVQNADGSITLGAVEGVSKAVYLRQKIENTNKLLGKTATISLLKDDNTIITATGDIPSTVPSSQTGVASAYIIENGVIFGTLSITFLPNSYVVASISAYAGKSVTFKAVKIELGSVSTLAMDTAPNYATELLKCQRYFYSMSGNQYFGIAMAAGITSGRADAVIYLPIEMRGTPTVTLQGTLGLYGGSTSIPLDSNINVINKMSNTLSLHLYDETNKAITPMASYKLMFNSANSYLYFSADL